MFKKSVDIIKMSVFELKDHPIFQHRMYFEMKQSIEQRQGIKQLGIFLRKIRRKGDAVLGTKTGTSLKPNRNHVCNQDV